MLNDQFPAGGARGEGQGEGPPDYLQDKRRFFRVFGWFVSRSNRIGLYYLGELRVLGGVDDTQAGLNICDLAKHSVRVWWFLAWIGVVWRIWKWGLRFLPYSEWRIRGRAAGDRRFGDSTSKLDESQLICLRAKYQPKRLQSWLVARTWKPA